MRSETQWVLSFAGNNTGVVGEHWGIPPFRANPFTLCEFIIAGGVLFFPPTSSQMMESFNECVLSVEKGGLDFLCGEIGRTANPVLNQAINNLNRSMTTPWSWT